MPDHGFTGEGAGPASPRHRKRQHANHITGRSAVDLVKHKLPEYWVTRELNPDYGLDLHIEVFDMLPDNSGSADTLGEHFYAQVKGTRGLTKIKQEVAARKNVTKYEYKADQQDTTTIDVVSFKIDVDELLTVEAMGAAVPAVLLVADLEQEVVYFLCLNDYVSKVLLPANPTYAEQRSVTVYIPVWNVLDHEDESFAYFWLLARRGKFYAAFNQFAYQQHEMTRTVTEHFASYGSDDTGRAVISPEVAAMLKVFLRANLSLDVWTVHGPGYWAPMTEMRAEYVWLRDNLPSVEHPTESGLVDEYVQRLERTMWRAVNLGRIYEEVVREWRLPTNLAFSLDYYPGSRYGPSGSIRG